MTAPLSWVVGAGGLLGSSVVRAIAPHGRLWSPAEPVTWADHEAAIAQIRRAASDFVAAADGGTWQIAWCAGAGVTATQLADLERELDCFTTLLDSLRTASERPGQQPGAVFLASSAGALYAGSQGAPFDEATPVVPISAYGRIKAEAESRVSAWAGETGGRVVVGRIANLYGPGQGLGKPQGLISQIIRSHLIRRPISIYVPLDTMRDYIYSSDCGQLVRDALSRLSSDGSPEGAVVTKILASHQQVTIGRVLAEIRRAFKRNPQIVLGSSPQAAMQARDLRLGSRVWPELDRRQLTPLSVGIQATIAHLREVQRAGRL
jgi:UDP-glucose 4-epimerase